MSMNQEPGSIQYTVQPGDTLWELADEYDIAVEDIIDVNPGIDPDNLQVGQIITLVDPQLQIQQRPGGGRRGGGRGPERFRPYRRPYGPYYGPYRPYYPYYSPYYPYAGGCPTGARPYTVQSGDNLYNIASRFGVSVDAIIATNPSVNFGLALSFGQLICIPY